MRTSTKAPANHKRRALHPTSIRVALHKRNGHSTRLARRSRLIRPKIRLDYPPRLLLLNTILLHPRVHDSAERSLDPAGVERPGAAGAHFHLLAFLAEVGIWFYGRGNFYVDPFLLPVRFDQCAGEKVYETGKTS